MEQSHRKTCLGSVEQTRIAESQTLPIDSRPLISHTHTSYKLVSLSFPHQQRGALLAVLRAVLSIITVSLANPAKL